MTPDCQSPVGHNDQREDQQMARTSEAENTGRRDFLKLATAAAPAAAVAAAVGATATEAEAATPKSGLQDTEHTRAYFASARF
tara:strand:+ start:152 stop:400 length:249 start_codon:yes stop_codon:yes gene_type:complete